MRFRCVGPDDQKREPAVAFLIGRHAIRALEDRLLDPAVRRDLDRVPNRQPVLGHSVMALVNAAVDGEFHRALLRGGSQACGLDRDLIAHGVQLKLEPMNGRKRVEAAIAMGVADRPPFGAWGHTYREEWSPADLAAVTVERARQFGWDFVKFQPRASSFAEAFGSVYKPAGHRLKGPVLESEAVADLNAWSTVALVNRKALDDQVESIHLVGKNSSRVVRELRKHPDLVRPAMDRIADALVDFSKRSVAAGAAGIFYAISGYASREAMPEDVYREFVLPTDLAVLGQLPHEALFNAVHLCGSKLHFDLVNDMPSQVVSWSIHNLGTPTLSQGRNLSGRAVMGGLGQRKSLLYGPPSEVQAEARRAIADTGGRGLLLAPGCSVPPRVRDINLVAIGEAVAA